MLLTLSGCGFVHFGRAPEAASNDAALNTAYSNLSTEYKVLKQELMLARRDGDALRTAIERGSAGLPSSELSTRLAETSKELTALRASYARLNESKAPAAGASAQSAELEEKLAASLRSYTQLQDENARLRADVDRTRAENTTLAAQVKTLAAQNEQINGELLAQKEGRARAEQQAAANAAQLSAVIANSGGKAPTLANARENTARPSTALSASLPVAELRTDVTTRGATPATPATAPIIHVVLTTDTLEKIALKYYGDATRWRTIYFANNSQLSGGRPLKAGMQLEIPQN